MPGGTAFPGAETAVREYEKDTSQSSQSSTSTMQHYNGSAWKNFVNRPDTFNTSVLIVAGGGSAHIPGNGGGGGGVLEELSLTASTNYTLQVGAEQQYLPFMETQE